MNVIRRCLLWSAIGSLLWVAANVGAQPLPANVAIAQFQRAADAYAFQHRQIERRAGNKPDQAAMARALRMARAVPAEGSLFTATVSAAFRRRIAEALRGGRCAQATEASAVVPRASDDAATTHPLAACVDTVLPRLPEELVYRTAGVSLLLVDKHARLVIDVLHGAFPAHDN